MCLLAPGRGGGGGGGGLGWIGDGVVLNSPNPHQFFETPSCCASLAGNVLACLGIKCSVQPPLCCGQGQAM